MYNLTIITSSSITCYGYNSYRDLFQDLRDRGAQKVATCVWRLDDGSYAGQTQEALEDYLLGEEIMV